MITKKQEEILLQNYLNNLSNGNGHIALELFNKQKAEMLRKIQNKLI